MNKRKKKISRPKDLAMSTFGLNRVADDHEAPPLHQRKFHEGDMVWLANEYRRRSSAEPSLTLEDFAAQHGVLADEIRAHVPELSGDFGGSVVLWHGTTTSRAEPILKEGFRAKRGGKRGIFFARNPSMARGYARGRARREGGKPALIMCSIDLGHYDDYERRGASVYAFKHECIAGEVVRNVAGLPRERREKQEKRKNTAVESTDVALTFNSGRAGITYWINSYLKPSDPHRISEDHEAVGKIKQWLNDQANAGRFGAVPDDEMQEQASEHLPQYSEVSEQPRFR